MGRRKFQSERFVDQPKKDPIENKIDLDDVNEITTDKEVEEEKPIIKTEEMEEREVPKYTKKIEKPKEETPKFVKGIVKVLSNMRSAPSMEASVIEVLPVGESIMIYDEPGDFFKVVHGETAGYVKKELCARVGSGIAHLI